MGSKRAKGIAWSVAAALLLSALGSTEEAELSQGIRLVKSGDFENAIAPLAALIVTLSPDLRRREELARAYLYLGIAYLELGQELEARGKFREALRNMPKTKLAPTEFSAQVRRIFEDEALAARPPRKKRLLPFLLVLGGGAATAGVAVAASGGSDPVTTTSLPLGNTTTTTLSGGGPGTTTTTTTQPSGGPTTTTTTLPGPTTTTTSTTSTTTSTTTTMPPACQYSATPDRTFGASGGSGVCNITASPQSCSWSVGVFPTGNSWLSLNGGTSGTGNGSVSYSVAALQLLQMRSALVRVNQEHSAGCNITQNGLLVDRGPAPLQFESRLEAPGARGQVVVNGSSVLFQEQLFVSHAGPAREGANRIEAVVVAADGKPGTWRLELASGYEPGSLVVLAGPATLTGAGSVVFQVSGQPGQRFVLFFQGSTARAPARPLLKPN